MNVFLERPLPGHARPPLSLLGSPDPRLLPGHTPDVHSDGCRLSGALLSEPRGAPGAAVCRRPHLGSRPWCWAALSSVWFPKPPVTQEGTARQPCLLAPHHCQRLLPGAAAQATSALDLTWGCAGTGWGSRAPELCSRSLGHLAYWLCGWAHSALQGSQGCPGQRAAEEGWGLHNSASLTALGVGFRVTLP